MILITVISCGHRKNPTGGKKDTIKPEIISITPTEYSDLTDQNIEVVFSKPIERSTILSGLIIYPPIRKKKFKWDKSTLTIRIMEKLEPNTNYFVTFTSRITGEHGNELAQEYTYVYSSGELSMNRISGRVVFEKEEDEKLPVLSTLMTSDSTFVFNRLIDRATFALDYLNNIDHILEAYCDKNQNDKYDYGDEPYCYLQIPADKFTSVSLEMTYSDTLKPTLKSARSSWNNQIEINFDEPVAEFQDISIASADSIPKPLNVIEYVLKDEMLLLLTEPMDTLKYQATLTGLTDLKKNRADTLSIILDSNALIDSIPPEIMGISPRNGGTVGEYEPIIRIEFSEIVLSENIYAKLFETETTNEISLRLISGDSDVYEFKPAVKLKNYSTYNILVEAKDLNENKLIQQSVSTFIVIILQ
jgi:ribonuclease HI